jgi:RimJ/RimL family protein N-acetyltransferase
MTAPLPITVTLRPVVDSDLDLFFEHQQDEQQQRQAAFISDKPADRAAFDAHWAKIRANPTVILRTVLAGGEIAGHVGSFLRGEERELTYWIGRDHQGRGIATAALTLLLAELSERPLFARAAHDNAASIRVLEKCGFRQIGTGRYFSNSRGVETDEVIMQLR